MPNRPYRLSRLRAWCLVALMTFSVSGSAITIPDHPASAQDLSNTPWSLIPGDATALITVDTSFQSAQWSTAASLLEAIGLREVVDDYLAEVLSELGVSASTLDPAQSPLFGGSVTVATWASSQDRPIPVALFLVAADPDAALQSLQAQLFPGEGATAIDVPVPAGRLIGQENSAAGLLFVNDVIVLGDLEILSTVADLAVGSGPSVAQFEPFQKVMAAQTDQAIARIYANGPAAGRGLAFDLANNFGLGPSELAALLTLGIPLAASYTSLGISAAPEGLRIRAAQLPAPIIGPPLPVPPTEGLAATVSADSELFLAGNDLGNRLLFSQLLDSIVVAAAASLGESPQQPTLDVRSWAYETLKEKAGIDLKSDLLEQLRGDFVFAARFGSSISMENVDLIVRSEVSDASAVRRVIDNLAVRLRFAAGDQDGAAGFLDFESMSVGTETLYVLTIKDYDGSGEDLSLSFGLLDGRLEVALNDGQALLQPSGNSLADDRAFTTVMDLLPDSAGSRFFLDVGQLIEVAGLIGKQPPAAWSQADDQFALLGNIRSLAGLNYSRDGMAITEMVLLVGPEMATSR